MILFSPLRFDRLNFCRLPFVSRLAAGTIVALLFQGASIGQTKSDAKDSFKYDYSKDFDLKQKGAERRDNVVIEDIDYASFQNRHKRIKAYLVRPKGRGPFAGVIFFHW